VDHDEDLPLIGTRWTALEISFNLTTLDAESTTRQLDPIMPNHPITLLLSSDRIDGSTGCNNYFGSLQDLSEESFSTSNFGLTRMYCRDVMEQERNYMRFLRNRTFFYNITTSEMNDELILSDAIPGPGGEMMRGEEILARFRASSDIVG